MKKIFYLLAVILVAMSVVNCSKDEEDINSGFLIGEWYWQEESVTFRFSESMGGRWQAENDEGGWKLENNTVYLTYWENPNEPIWGTYWKITKLTSKQLTADVYDGDGKQGKITLIKVK